MPPETSTPVPAHTETPLPTETETPVPMPTQTPGPCGMSFSDLADDHWAYSFIADLFCRHAISGYSDGTIRPNEGSTRGQFVKMAVLALGYNLYNPVVATFSDVEPDSPFYVYIETATLRGLIGGYSDGTFRPNGPITRAQSAKILVLSRGWELIQPPTATFSDVPTDDWAYPYVETALSRGILGGYADGTFRPGQTVTRAQLSKMLVLTLQQGARQK